MFLGFKKQTNCILIQFKLSFYNFSLSAKTLLRLKHRSSVKHPALLELKFSGTQESRSSDLSEQLHQIVNSLALRHRRTQHRLALHRRHSTGRRCTAAAHSTGRRCTAATHSTGRRCTAAADRRQNQCRHIHVSLE